MSDAVSVRRLEADEWQAYRDLRLRALAESPDAFGSTLAVEAEFPEERWSTRLAQGASSASDLPLAAERAGERVGLAWGRIEPFAAGEVHVYQMWVAPEARGQGAGRRLLETIVDWGRASNAHAVLLGVTCGDTPANHLYRALGFQPVGEPAPLRPDSTRFAQQMTLLLQSRGVGREGR